MNKVIFIIIIIAVILLFYFGVYKPQKATKEAEKKDDENQYQKSNFTKDASGNIVVDISSIDFKTPPSQEAPKDYLLINGEKVPIAYPVGSDNVIPADTKYANSEIAKVAYTGDIARAITEASHFDFPLRDGTNRTKLLATLEQTSSWRHLISKIKNDRRIDDATKVQLISDVNRIAWDGILADVRGNRTKRINNAIIITAAVGLAIAAVSTGVGVSAIPVLAGATKAATK